MAPSTAQWYRFHASAPAPEPSASQPHTEESSTQQLILGPEEAFQELKARGCRLATLPWVENHWGLILWKLAGMVALDPQSEADVKSRRWCWAEVVRQLLYRYERELDRGTRPPLRLIAAQDKPAGLPMVLCVSAISWPSAPDTGSEVPPQMEATHNDKPEVEMTDGWYRVRVEVGDSMIRAIRRGALRVGMKVGVVGARLLDRRAEPFELLENPLAGVGQEPSFALTVSGNGCHLAPWHAKLGFHSEPFVATLGSLTPDGGLVPVMDLKIIKTFPIAYIEFFNSKGEKSWSAPMKEPEEAKAQDAWNAKRDAAVQRIREKMDKLSREWEKQADRLEIRAGLEFKPRPEDTQPDTIDDLLCTMEDALTTPQPYECPQDIVSRTSRAEAGWLARAMREKIANDRENMAEEIEIELQTECPPRKVRNFRVLVVEDAETRKRPKQFRAQVTIWDVLAAYVSEDGTPGDFRAGERFIATNLEPNNTSAWMPRGDEAEIYLIARRDTRWRKMKASRVK
ncbi:uncharacterized protein PHACADRAFT_248310 [Phanerochaete carnosa HHB-10118-sp]|uniref:BRCA2 OB1 domain-containing protein n=1 Tax=Phanerochaete carnosa (strain HHB-10118-sp) TaxID=650164 RepID=K5WCB8_PHACS|nr:uncharacterized protein PHACADRAFT_248310 [Phanerochaete carnosa HHB-10118-sp]EKM61613.1 hypothetical protein PHACADRAFT_248310 [Phanerochaete carnosa HHB-10118-sp]